MIPDPGPINPTISRLSLEAINEIERITEAGGLERDDVKQSAWNVLGLMRNITREQFRRSGMRVEPRDTVRMSSSGTKQAVQLNHSIMSIALDAKKGFQNLAPNAPLFEKRSILEGRLQRNTELRWRRLIYRFADFVSPAVKEQRTSDD